MIGHARFCLKGCVGRGDLVFRPASDDCYRPAQITPGVAWRVVQGQEHILRPPPLLLHAVRNYGILAVEPVLVPKPLNIALRRMGLLSGKAGSAFQVGVDNTDEGLNFGPPVRALAAITRGAPNWSASCVPCPDAVRTPGTPPGTLTSSARGAGRTRAYISTSYIHLTLHRLLINLMKGGERYGLPPPQSDDGARPRGPFYPRRLEWPVQVAKCS